MSKHSISKQNNLFVVHEVGTDNRFLSLTVGFALLYLRNLLGLGEESKKTFNSFSFICIHVRTVTFRSFFVLFLF